MRWSLQVLLLVVALLSTTALCIQQQTVRLCPSADMDGFSWAGSHLFVFLYVYRLQLLQESVLHMLVPIANTNLSG